MFGIRDGIQDARTGRSPYFWTVLTDQHERKARLQEGLAATAKIIGLGFILDAIYQYLKLGTFYPGEAVIIVIVLAFVPYLLVRGPAARVARVWTNLQAKKNSLSTGPEHGVGIVGDTGRFEKDRNVTRNTRE
jgi:hypothetical protein